jgi:hypothetical protein
LQWIEAVRSRNADIRVLGEALGILSGFQIGLPITQREFLTNLTVGIISAKSCQLSEIARALLGESTPRPPHELQSLYHRLDEELGKYDLERPYERAQSLMISELDSSCLFIFDPSELVKPFGKKLEAIALVRDASAPPVIVTDPKTGKRKKKPVLKPGYPLRVAVAMNSAGELIPLALSLYSTRGEKFYSSNDENIQVIEGLLHRSNFQPTLILDREFDAFSIYRYFCQLRQKFIIRVKKNRRFYPPDEPRSLKQKTYSREEILGKCSYLETQAVIQFTRHGATESVLCSFKAARVRLLSEERKQQTFRETGDLDALILVRLKLHKVQGIPTLYLLTTTRPITEGELQRVGLNYLARWNVEEYIRFLKQYFGLEKFLVRDLGRMQNLMRAVYIATVVLHQITDIKRSQGLRTQRHLVFRSAPVRPEKKTKDFYWYSYARGLANIVQWNRKLFTSLNFEKNPRPKKAA